MANLNPDDVHQRGRPSCLMLLRTVVTMALVAVMAIVSAVTATARVIGPDVSSHNHDNKAGVSWRLMHRVGGASFAFIKATEGLDYHNPSFAADFTAARLQELFRGAYHYARPGGRTRSQIVNEATLEANFFIRATGNLAGPGNLPPVLDLEDAGNLSPSQLALWVRVWLERVELLTGRTPIIYTYGFFWRDSLRNSRQFAAYPLWLASNGVPAPARLGGWKSYTFWQYTDSGRMAGSSHLVDLNVFNGSMKQLRAMSLKRSMPSKKRAKVVKPAKSVPLPLPQPSTTLRYTTRPDTPHAAAQGAGRTPSWSSLHPWPGVFGMDASRVFSGS